MLSQTDMHILYYVLCLYAIIQIWKSQIWINRLRRIKYGENHLWKTVIMV